MIEGVFISLVLICSMVFELLFGNFGLPFAATIMAVFYFSIQQSKFKAVLIAIICGFALDLIYGRTFLISPLAMTMSVYFACWWNERFGSQIVMHCIPGAIVGAAYAFMLAAANSSAWNIYRLAEVLSLVFCACCTGAVLLPAMLVFLDGCAKFFNFRSYTEAIQKKIYRR